MSVANATWWRDDFKLREPYTIAYETYDAATNFFVRLVATDGTEGFGCAAPAEEVTGESTVGCAEALERMCGELTERGESAAASSADARRRSPAAAAAVDMALTDLRARELGLPVCSMLGGHPSHLPTSITIGISSLGETRKQGKRFAREGFRALKVKGGADPLLDAERILALRADLGPDMELRFDANEGYGEASAVQFLRAVQPCVLSVFEQPCARGDTEATAAVATELAMLGAARPALLLDEGAVTAEQVAATTAATRADGVVVKLMKCGGLVAAQHIDRIAAAQGLRTMISCMDESALAIAAGLHYALAARRCTWIDLDGHLDLIDDPGAAAVILEDGLLRPLDAPGFGVSLTP